MKTEYKHHYINEEQYCLHYVSTGKPEKQPILFIHGVLSNWTNFKEIMEDPFMQEHYYMFSVDRLCWGESRIQNQNVETRIDKHSQAISLLLENVHLETQKKIHITGHSFGGIIATYLAIKHKQFINKLTTISCPFDHDDAKPHWYTRFGNLFMIKITLPKHLVRANDEATAISKELHKLEPIYKQLTINTTLLHGENDRVISSKHMNYAKNKFMLSEKLFKEVLIKNGEHFILRKNKNEIIENAFQNLNNSTI